MKKISVSYRLTVGTVGENALKNEFLIKYARVSSRRIAKFVLYFNTHDIVVLTRHQITSASPDGKNLVTLVQSAWHTRVTRAHRNSPYSSAHIILNRRIWICNTMMSFCDKYSSSLNSRDRFCLTSPGDPR